MMQLAAWCLAPFMLIGVVATAALWFITALIATALYKLGFESACDTLDGWGDAALDQASVAFTTWVDWLLGEDSPW